LGGSLLRQLYSDGPLHLVYPPDRAGGVDSLGLLNFGVDRCPVKFGIPKIQNSGASECPDPTPFFMEASE